MGNFVHDILENLYKAEASTRTLATARILAANIWTEYEERASRVARTPEAIRRFRMELMVVCGEIILYGRPNST